MYCGTCGQKNEDTAKYCSACGKELEQVQGQITSKEIGTAKIGKATNDNQNVMILGLVIATIVVSALFYYIRDNEILGYWNGRAGQMEFMSNGTCYAYDKYGYLKTTGSWERKGNSLIISESDTGREYTYEIEVEDDILTTKIWSDTRGEYLEESFVREQ